MRGGRTRQDLRHGSPHGSVVTEAGMRPTVGIYERRGERASSALLIFPPFGEHVSRLTFCPLSLFSLPLPLHLTAVAEVSKERESQLSNDSKGV